MATYSTSLKTWGSTGQEFPDNYNYIEGEQPVDAWDNFFNSNVINDLEHLINLTNARFADKNGNEASAGGVRLQNAEWLAGRNAANDGDVNMWQVNGSDVVESDAPVRIGGDLIATNGEVLWDESNTYIPDARLENDYVTNPEASTVWFQKQEGGTVPAGDYVPVGTFGVDDGETLEITQAMLTEDGFNTPAPSGINLVVVTTEDTTAPDSTVISGDGTTLYDDETGSPLVSYSNSSGSHQTATVAINNGDLGQAGVGTEQVAYGGYIARTV